MNGQKIGVDNWKQQRGTSTFSSRLLLHNIFPVLKIVRCIKWLNYSGYPLIKNALINRVDDAGFEVSS
jgi:hypothetical protein